jgi:hypothetical protein
MTWVASLSRRHDAAGRLVIFGQRGVAWRGVAWRGVAGSAAQRSAARERASLDFCCSVLSVGLAQWHMGTGAIARLAGWAVPSRP